MPELWDIKARIELINKSFGKRVLYSSRNESFEGLIASEVHPETNVVGLDLEDGFPITFLAHIDYITLIELQ